MTTTAVPYTIADFCLVRAASSSLERYHDLLDRIRDLPPTAALDVLVSHAREPEVHKALSIASPDLVAALDRHSTSRDTAEPGRREDRRAARLASRLLRYFARMSSRATPFGTFAGIAWGDLREDAPIPVLPPASHRIDRARPDMAWVLGCIRDLESDPRVRASLFLVPHALVHRSGDRLILPVADAHGRGDQRTVSVRLTAPLEHVLNRLQQQPTRYDDLVEDLGRAFPAVPPDTIAGFVAELWDLHILISDLRPSLVDPRADRQLRRKLEVQLASNRVGEEVAALLRERIEVLTRIDDLLSGPDPTTAALAEAAALQRQVVPEHTGSLVQVDRALTGHAIPVPRTMVAPLEEAYGVLSRLNAARSRPRSHLREYREAFMERYGAQALLPVATVLDLDEGLGPPDGYLAPPRPFPLERAPMSSGGDYGTGYERFLAGLLTDPSVAADHVVDLAAGHLDQLTPVASDGWSEELRQYPLVDAYVQVHRATGEAGAPVTHLVVRDDTFSLGGRTYGRFHDMLPPTSMASLQDLAAAWRRSRPDAVIAELCYLPSSGHAANVAVRPLLTDHEIVLNAGATAGDDARISLDDLEVGITASRLFLWCRRLQREVVVIQSHMLNEQMAPNVARFLLDVSGDGYVMPSGFTWGRLEGAASLPRVVHRDVVLRPAVWTLSRPLLTTLAPDAPLSDEAIAQWRERYRVPRWVYAADFDNRLLLDLDHPACLRELVSLLDDPAHAQGLVINEMLPGVDGTWMRGNRGERHASELVVPLVATDPQPLSSPTNIGPMDTGRRHGAGGDWCYIVLYVNTQEQDGALIEEIGTQCEAWVTQGVAERWFHIRYTDPRPHLRLRIRRAVGRSGSDLLRLVVELAERLVTRGQVSHYSLLPYVPEEARYGGSDVFPLVEETFHASSRLALALMPFREDCGGAFTNDQVGMAAVLALFRQWGYPTSELADVLPQGEPSDRIRTALRTDAKLLVGLAEAVLSDTVPADLAALHTALATGAPEHGRAGDAVRAAEREGRLRGNQKTLVGSLAHMLVNRLMPIDLGREAEIYFLCHEVLRTLRSRRAAREKGLL